jgi:hypothetical protein
MFVARFSSAGELSWAVTFDVASDQPFAVPTAITFTADGSIDVGGQFKRALSIPGGPVLDPTDDSDDLFVIRLDPQGQYRFSASFGNEHDERIVGFRHAPDGACVLYATFHGLVDFGDGPIGNDDGLHLFNLARVELDPNGEHRSSDVLIERRRGFSTMNFASGGEFDVLAIERSVEQYDATGAWAETIPTEPGSPGVGRSDSALLLVSYTLEPWVLRDQVADAESFFVAKLCDPTNP